MLRFAGQPDRPFRVALISLGCVLWTVIPVAGAADATPAQPPPGKTASAPQKAAPTKPVKVVDINKASRAELKTLPGVGDAEASKIIDGRPWLTKADLVTKNALPEGVYVSIKDRIIAKQPAKPTQQKK